MNGKTMLFLYNLHAGKGQVKAHLSEMLDTFTKAGWLVTVHPTQSEGDAAATAAALGGGFDRIVCCGGDGTLHEVVEGLMALSQRPEVGYIPAGSTNDFARNLALPRDFAQMAETAAAGVPRPCDIGRFNHRYFVYVAAFGAFTDVSYDTPQQFKNLFGHLAYLMEGVARLPNLKCYPLRVTHDGGEIQEEFLYGMVSNTISVGGFKGLTGDHVSLDDGVFEVLLIRRPRKPGDIQSIIRTLLQQSREENELVFTFRTSRFQVECQEELPWTLDGEFGGAPELAQIENCHKAVSIVHGE